MMIRISLRLAAIVAAAAALVPAVTGTTAAAATAQRTTAQESSQLGATWDAPNTKVRLYDPQAVSATVVKSVQQSATDNPVCDLYIATYTLTFTAINGHRLTSQGIYGDDYSVGFQVLDTSVFTMAPGGGGTIFEQAPTQQLWFLKGTQQTSAECPPALRTINHVEIYLDGTGRTIPHSIVKPPSKNHLAALWTWPAGVQISSPPRVDVSVSSYQELEQPEGACQATFTEVDVTFIARAPARIIAVGIRTPGSPIQYQNGNSDNFGLGIGQHEWFLTGTHTKSSECPADTLSQDRIEIYTDVRTIG